MRFPVTIWLSGLSSGDAQWHLLIKMSNVSFPVYKVSSCKVEQANIFWMKGNHGRGQELSNGVDPADYGK